MTEGNIVAKKKAPARKSARLKLKKETLKDLDARGTVKGGARRLTAPQTPICPT